MLTLSLQPPASHSLDQLHTFLTWEITTSTTYYLAVSLALDSSTGAAGG